MLVSQILKLKGTEKVTTISPDASVSEAAKMLSDLRIGSLVVSPDGEKVAGILSERDIVRELGRRGSGCLTEKVQSMMTASVTGCAPDDRADEILAKMTEGRFRHMPVLVNDKMVGLISIGDVVKARLMELSMEKEALEGMIMGY